MVLSIIVPIYNQEKYLRKCLDSIISQEGSDFEIILINDGSTDSSEEICKEYVAKYSFIRYYYQENKGLGSARNLGIKMALGKYLMFVDSDDAIIENAITPLMEFTLKDNYDLVYFDEIIADEKLNILNIQPTFPKMTVDINKNEALKYSMQPSHICSRIYKKELFNDLEFMNIWYEDMAIFPLLVNKSEKIGYYKVPIYYYRQHTNSITSKSIDKRSLEVITAWNNVLENLNNDEARHTIKIAVYNFLYFRKEYISDLLLWYNDNFVCEVGKVCIPNETYGASEIYEPDITYPLIQQAKFFDANELLDIIYKLEWVYFYGGKVIFSKNNLPRGILNSKVEKLVISNELCIIAIIVQKNNVAIKDILDNVRVQNLISLKGQLKEIDYNKLVIQAFINHNIKIELLEK